MSAVSVAGAAQSNPAKAELLADVATVKAGDSFTIGVLFQIKPQWHIYWKNPGDSGLPTSVKFTVPEGFSVGRLLWPVPTRFNQPGNIVGYGYAESVLLSARVKAPKSLPAGSTIRVHAEVSWLCCEKACIPGKADLELKLPVAESVASANRKLFASWEKRLPVDADSASSPLVAKIAGKIPARAASAPFTISLQWKFSPAGVDWFPASDPALNIENVTCKTEGSQTNITFAASILPGQNLSSDQLETLVVYTGPNGERGGVNLLLRLRDFNQRGQRVH